MTIPIPESVTAQEIYRVYIEWDHDDLSTGLNINQRILNFKRSKRLEVTDSAAYLCWTYYLVIQGPSKSEVESYASKVLRHLKKHRADLYTLL